MTQPNDIIVFDRDLIKRRRARVQANFPDHDFLHRWGHAQISDRLLDINKSFDISLNIGSRLPQADTHSKIETIYTVDTTPAPFSDCANYMQADAELLPLRDESLDLIISNIDLHTVNDLPGTLIQINRALKADGLFIASILGGETLHELRSVLTETELELQGGASPRVAPFADKPQMGDLMQRAGFALPVVDSEIITVTYDNVFKLFADLRGMGESNAIAARNKSPVSKSFFMRAAQKYHEQFAEADGRIVATFEIIFLLGWAPHDSQQKPLRPGTAKHSLAEALGTTEHAAGDTAKP